MRSGVVSVRLRTEQINDLKQITETLGIDKIDLLKASIKKFLNDKKFQKMIIKNIYEKRFHSKRIANILYEGILSQRRKSL